MNSIKLFNKFSTKMLKNNVNLQLMTNLADKFLFSIFKLINKVRFFIFNIYYKIIFIDIRNKKRKY